MSEQPVDENNTATPDKGEAKDGRRPALRKLGRFAAITPPVIALLLAAAAKPPKAFAISIL